MTDDDVDREFAEITTGLDDPAEPPWYLRLVGAWIVVTVVCLLLWLALDALAAVMS